MVQWLPGPPGRPPPTPSSPDSAPAIVRNNRLLNSNIVDSRYLVNIVK